MSRRFAAPWSIEERQESFIVKDANGQQLACPSVRSVWSNRVKRC
jgi:hypothetical protein